FGNPPFMGGRNISGGLGKSMLEWLLTSTPESGGQSDIVAYFFRRAFSLSRQEGTFGMLATNTVAQGDTRRSGLTWLCVNGGIIYSATRRIRWPGSAAVVVIAVHIVRGHTPRRHLDGREVSTITA